MESQNLQKKREPKTLTLIKKCHCCGHLMESSTEPERCEKCNKAFLPSRYFSKIHAKNSEEFRQLFEESQELHEEDLIKGLHVLW
jgi:hypothetical protein